MGGIGFSKHTYYKNAQQKMCIYSIVVRLIIIKTNRLRRRRKTVMTTICVPIHDIISLFYMKIMCI